MGSPKWTVALCAKYDSLYRELPPRERFRVVSRWRTYASERKLLYDAERKKKAVAQSRNAA